MVVYSPAHPSPLYVVSASGGEPRAVTELASDSGGHFYPHFLPDGRRFLFVEVTISPDGVQHHSLAIGTLDEVGHQRIGIASRAEYVDGYLLFAEGDTLFAQ